METVNITEKEVSKMFQIPSNALKRCRSEKKFDSVDNLIENIKKDVKFAQKFFEDGK